MGRIKTKEYVKKKVKIKIGLILLCIFLIPIFLVSCMSTILLILGGADEIEAMKEMDIPYRFLRKAYKESKKNNLKFSKVLTYAASEACLNEDNYTNEVLDIAIDRAKKRSDMTRFEKDLYDIYRKIYDDLEVGPIPEKKVYYKWDKKLKEWKIHYKEYFNYSSYNDFGAERTYGGYRRHEGNDLIADLGTPIVSITDGVVTAKGWNEYGGERVGITTKKDTYFYYAHLDRYENGIEIGKHVSAGDIIGYVGDTGYGPPGTRGKLISHLHLQIGFKLGLTKERTWFCPYNIVKFLDEYRITFREKKD